MVIRDFLIYIFIGFFIIFLMSLSFPHDICGSEEMQSSPSLFFGFGVGFLSIFYFINKAVKKTWLFLIIVMATAFIFEYFYVNNFLRIEKFEGLWMWIFLPLYWAVWFGATRFVFNKLK
jgi:hypothetical protein